jgi:Cu-Zn family superoxide dismutase
LVESVFEAFFKQPISHSNQTIMYYKSFILHFLFAIGAITLFSFFSCKKEKFSYAEAVISGTQETSVTGTIKFYEQKDKKVKMDLEVLVPARAGQSVAVHLHEHGDCGNAGGNTHGHWNPTGKAHGKWGEGQFHSGDIGNITLDANGRGKLTLVTDLWSIGGSEQTNIVNRGVIVHGGVDDYTTQPSGNSGPRIGCGVVVMK